MWCWMLKLTEKKKFFLFLLYVLENIKQQEYIYIQ